ncbi:hypothetical protein GCM10022199_16280 [Marihabitans asiaticum]
MRADPLRAAGLRVEPLAFGEVLRPPVVELLRLALACCLRTVSRAFAPRSVLRPGPLDPPERPGARVEPPGRAVLPLRVAMAQA